MKIRGKRTYILCGLGMLHGLLDLFEFAPGEGSFDAGNTQALAEILGAGALAYFRVGVANAQYRMERALARIDGQLKDMRNLLNERD